ncbi:uncharacterized protein F5891DRAFT_978036 [Suillus fuscotomentosus]|uniref:Uncharacterized protein n=1 Tax=Suillus fuscotomentosus TaxID=1912939 RepID=A0AAD4HQ72_9AGAM|nr:uncharacterized protein F5891DRAFT_978036 [Suillus fuscotomentosus]KAG1903479.1 hypothetical protein F5891DRAFT_978036 [Suillus fuscotomentosus]
MRSQAQVQIEMWQPSSLLRSQTAPPIDTWWSSSTITLAIVWVWSSYAMEHARAKHAGLKVVSVLNADDVLPVHESNQDGKAVRHIYFKRPSPTRSHAECLAFQLVANGHVEVGLGLHIEPGVRRALLESSRWLATGMLCLTSYMAENGAEQGSTRVKNNLDGVLQLEIGAVVREVRGVPGNSEDDVTNLLTLRVLNAPIDAHSWLCVHSWPAVRATCRR